MMKKIVGLALSGFFVLVSVGAMAQTYAEEALLFSRISPGGSARIQAMGGSQVALGGDYSTAFSNPAGLGFFNKSEGSISLGTNFYNATSNYLGNITTDSKSNFNIPGFSLVLHSDKSNGKLVSGNFALSFSRTNNFNQNFSYKGVNNNNSLIDYFIERSNGYYPEQFRQNGSSYNDVTRLGFSNYLFGPVSEVIPKGDSSRYHTYANQVPLQHERVQLSGAQNQFNVSYGLNFNDFFYLGATVGFPSFNYHSQKAYSETFPGGPLFGFNLNEDYTIKGSGINTTIGAIVRPVDFVQFGLSVATPTYFYSVSDNYSATLASGWNNYRYVDTTYMSKTSVINGFRDSITQIVSNYTLTTPWRIKAGATFFIKKHALITGELENVNYSKSKFSSQTDGLDLSADNQEIKTTYKSVLNIRLGGEYRFDKFRARLGYSYMPDPYAVQNKIDNTITSLSIGFGYRTDKYFVDLAVVDTQWNSSYHPYSIDTKNYPQHGFTPVAKIQNTNTSVMVTVGLTL